MSTIKRVIVIYNPNSTGKAEDHAKKFRKKLKQFVDIPVRLVPTDHRGHGLEIAQKLASKDPNIMIISSSGDGGYHDVVNGVLASSNPSVVTGLLPAGNANDHYNFMHQSNVEKRILAGKSEYADVIEISSSRGWTRYAHSYAGIGLTSQINDILSKYSFNPIREALLVAKHIFRARPVTVRVNGHIKKLDNLLFLNAGRMSKIVKTTGQASIRDGKFEVVEHKSGAILQILRYFIKAVTVGLAHAKQMDSYELTCLHRMGIQMDGERMTLHKGETLTIRCKRNKLRSII